ncbi:hypothetical protein [Aromatoleum buckelii]|uniref:Uncharacterized protein n=1 Tax=Aromatoleum buckelii TaxID=200254 RepID=A0ABX1N4Z3_9RHOO|nr:hypothetical protein [Aromatoleum buckelii]MCK0509713.1 hypothetical protein [Aromatoleum buckelii]
MGAQDQRPRFFEGQYLSADDLTAIVDAQRIGDARHVLGAHTWGIAVGLTLSERAAPGAPNRVDVTLLPGFGWDGFGRPLAVARPTRLPETLFAQIPFSPALDDPNTGTGRLVPVWIAYDEIATGNPQPGFETCATDDQTARIGESFRFVVGQQPPAAQRSPVTIGTASVDALDALTQFDAAAPKLWDTSVPHQTFPAGKPPRWLVPLGFVRWIARDNALGYFAKRDLVATDEVDGRIAALRRYAGVVAERIEAAARVIVLHARGEDPTALHRYVRLLADPAKVAALQDDLVWVEGNLRIGGDAKINGGKLHLRDGDGEERKTPLYLARFGDDLGGDGKRELRVAIGDTSQTDNRLFVGPVEAGGTIAPRLVVVSGAAGNTAEGRVGVNTATPAAALEVKGDWAGNEDGALRLSGAQPTLRFDGGVGGETWIAQLTNSPAGSLRLAHRTGPGTWRGVVFVTPNHRVGVGADVPRNPLAVRGQTSASPDFDELISLEDAGGASKWHFNLHRDPAGKALNVAETGVADGRLYLQAGGNVGIGTLLPAAKLHVQGDRVRVENVTGAPGSRVLELRTDGSAVDVQSTTSHLYLRSTHPGGPADRHIVMNPSPGGEPDGLVGIGLVPHVQKLEVKGNILFGAVPNLFAVGANAATRMIFGRIEADGSFTGSGFVAVRNGAGSGNYSVSFAPLFSGAPIVVATPIDSLNDDNVLTLSGVTSAGFVVRVRDVVGGGAPSPQDTAFSFIAIGTS